MKGGRGEFEKIEKVDLMSGKLGDLEK